MSERNRAILVGLAALLPTGGSGRLDAEAVNGLGAALGLDGPAVLAAVESMKADGLIDLHWGPELSLTDKGRRRAAGEPEPTAGVTLHAGATYIGGSVGNNTNVGSAAGAIQSTVAVGSIVNGVPAGLLAAALMIIQKDKASLPAEAREAGEALEKELEDTAAAALEAGSKDGATALARVGEGLRRSTELLSQVEEAGGKLANVGGMIKIAWDAIAPHLPTLGS